MSDNMELGGNTSNDRELGALTSASPTRKKQHVFYHGLFIGCAVGVVVAVLSSVITGLIVHSIDSAKHSPASPSSSIVGSTPLIPTMCQKLSTDSEPIGILVEVDGKPYAMIPDTGSSNFNLAADICGRKCDVHPRWPWRNAPRQRPTFEIVYGTGGAVLSVATANLSLGGLTVPKGSFGAIVDQYAGTDGFNLFPPPSDPFCYNTYAGVLGLAYKGQDAGPADETGNTTTNGTTETLLDQLTAHAGMPNAFAMELCVRYPMPCGPRKLTQTWMPMRSCDVNYTIGNFYLGGYRSSSLARQMQFTPITDEIHYDVILLGIEVCGERGCKNITFPDKIGGATEDDCVCKQPSCPIPLDEDEYCYFTVVDSGADGIFMNTVGNTKALLSSMQEVGMVIFPFGHNDSSIIQSFYFNQTSVFGASPSRLARFTLYFPDVDGGKPFGLHVPIVAIFMQTMAGLVQQAVQGNLEVAAAFQSAKFPVLLGSPVMEGQVTFFDRSRRRLGFAEVRPEVCGKPVINADAEIDVRGLVGVETPGVGCRRGTGSGGGCSQAKRSDDGRWHATT